MKLLIVDPFVPYPLDRGVFHRVYNVARELARHHEVDLFCLDDAESEEHRPVFEEWCRRVHFHPFANAPWPKLFPDRLLNRTPTTIRHWTQPAAGEALRTFVNGNRYDMVQFGDLVMWQYVVGLPAGPRRVIDRSRVDLLFQTEELAHLQLTGKEKFLRRENLFKLRRYEQEVARGLTSTVVCGPDDETFLRQEVPAAREIKVLANGVDEHFFRRDLFPPTPDPEPTILFCGAMDYSPNVSGLRWYFEKVDPLVLAKVPNRKLLIVGKSPVPEVQALGERPGVTVTGSVPDVRPYYQRAWLQMVPLLIGGGTRLKIVESLAIGTPVVSTTIGAQGLTLIDDEHCRLADEPETFAAALTEMLREPAQRHRLAESGRDHVLAHYTWSSLGKELSTYYEGLLDV